MMSGVHVKKIVVGLLAAAALAGAQAGGAAAPQVKTQAPGFYRMMLGDFEVTTVLDGTIDLPVNDLLTNIAPAQIESLLRKQSLKAPVETSVNTFLINTGTKLVLIDTGAGSLFGPTVGKLLTNLKAAGYSADQIDAVCITHMHGDHLGGLVANGQRTFPNAVVHVDKADADYWLSKANLNKAAAEAKGGFQTAAAVMKPYQDAGKFQPVNGQPLDGGSQIVPGIRSVASHGHTPGHSLYSVESKGQKLVLWGDLLHVAAVQFPEPSATIRFDTDSPAARAQREKALADAAAGGYWVGIAHVPFPGIGHVRAESKGYGWTPINYSANR
jgi:glyoxylase-like metal-dependent hydrolase (beta-lactamase superfamily II)